MKETQAFGDFSPGDSEPEQSTRWRPSISTRLLIAVNGVCAVLLLVFSAYDHQQAIRQRLKENQIALQEEAMIVLSAIREHENYGADELQRFINSVCHGMEATHPRGHHIIVRSSDPTLQTQSHCHASVDMLQSVETAATHDGHRGQFDDQQLIVGVAHKGNLSVYISEFSDDVYSEVLRNSLRRLAGSLVLGVLAAIIVNIVLLRIVVRPLERLIHIVNAVGRGEFGRQVDGFRSRELSYLSFAINRMSRTLEDSDRQRKMQLEKARRIQQNLLPESPDLAGATIAVHYRPAEDVAGDFYDVRRLADGSRAVLLADVTGHGIPAAMSATLLKAHFAEACEHLTDALEMIRHVNSRFIEWTLPEDFATAVLIRFIPSSRTLHIVNAGHDAVLYRSADGRIEECRSSGLLLGVDPDSDWSIDVIEASSHDRLLVYTDGVSETFNSEKALFGRDRIRTLFTDTAELSPNAALESVIDAIDTFRGNGPQLDDITAILIEF